MSASAEIFVVSGPGPGHLHPCTELCLRLTRDGYRTTLVIPSRVSSAIPPSFASNPLVTVAPLAASFGHRKHFSDPLNQSAVQDLSAHLEKRTAGSEVPRVLCAVADLKVWWTKEVLWKFDVPVISFFTFGSRAAAIGLGWSRTQVSDVQHGGARLIRGLPEEMAVTYSDLKREPSGPPRGGPPGPSRRPGGGGGGPPKPSDQLPMSASAEIFVVSGPGAGHLHPCMELCLLLTRHGYHTTLVIRSRVSSDIPPSFASNPLITVVPIAAPFRHRRGVSEPHNQSANQELSAHLEKRTAGSELPRVLCAVVDLKVWTTKEVFWKFDVPVISFFTFGACAAAMGLGSWRARISDVQPGEARLIPQLPEEMAVTYSDLKRKPGPTGGGGPPKPGDQPTWVWKVEGSIGLMFNTCADLERPFLDYMGDQMKMPVWGVGPLLPEQYWKTSGSPISDREIRQHTHESSCTEDEVIQWLDCKPRRSVLYVAFGSEMGPEEEEMVELAAALEETTRDFIWHIGPPRYGADFSDRVESKVGDSSVIIKGWAPQLLILSHPSTGGFLSHCGWNSTVEAIGLGVPFLAWPIIGDQYYNAKLVVCHLQVGYRVAEDMSQVVKKDEIVTGIERLMCDEEMHERAASIKAKFGHGFPASSSAFDAFRDFINARL